MNAKWLFLADRKAGEMTNAIVTESDRLGGAFTICLSLLASVVVAIIYIALSLMIAWQITVSLIGFAAVAALAMAPLTENLTPQVRAWPRSTRNFNRSLSNILPERNLSKRALVLTAQLRASNLWCRSSKEPTQQPVHCRGRFAVFSNFWH